MGRCYGQFNNQLALLVHALAAAAAMGRVIWGRYGGDRGVAAAMGRVLVLALG